MMMMMSREENQDWTSRELHRYPENSIVFAIFFFISGLWHLEQCIVNRSRSLSVMLTVGALTYGVGFVLDAIRVYGSEIPEYDTVWMARDVFILYAAPTFFELSNSYILIRLFLYLPHLAPLRPRLVAFITTFLLAVSVILGLYGTISMAYASKASPWIELVITALYLQLAFLCLFLIALAMFYGNCKRKGMDNMTTSCRARVNGLLLILYLSSILIAARTIYCIVHCFKMVSTNFLWGAQPTFGFWLFGASFMLLNTVMLNFRHPSKYLPTRSMTYVGEDGIERTEPKSQVAINERNGISIPQASRA